AGIVPVHTTVPGVMIVPCGTLKGQDRSSRLSLFTSLNAHLLAVATRVQVPSKPLSCSVAGSSLVASTRLARPSRRLKNVAFKTGLLVAPVLLVLAADLTSHRSRVISRCCSRVIS